MLKHGVTAVLGLALLGMPALVGCERELAHEEEVDVRSDGTVKKEETTVTERPDGTIVKEESESRSNP